MVSPTMSCSPQKLTIVLLLFCIITFSSPIEATITASSKLDQPTNTEIKCGSCPCGNSCSEQLSPPPPPPPSPPPLFLPEVSSPQSCDPSPPPPSPPPPSPPPPSRPPPPRFIYVTGVPGDQYAYYYSAAPNMNVWLLALAGLGTLLVTLLLG